MPDTSTILLVEDSDIMRRSCKSFFEVQEGLALTWTVETGAAALDLLDDDGVAPDLFLLDFSLPDVEAPALIPDLLERRPDARILVISGYEDAVRAQEVRDAGGHGYVRKGDAQRIPDAARTVLAGDTYLPDPTSG
jgi:DNA-binding NarL/FixJ family response regulator